MVGNLIIFFAALFAVLNKNSIGSGVVGLSISYALQVRYKYKYNIKYGYKYVVINKHQLS